jgi:hypothetical protein
LPSQSVGLHV